MRYVVLLSLFLTGCSTMSIDDIGLRDCRVAYMNRHLSNLRDIEEKSLAYCNH